LDDIIRIFVGSEPNMRRAELALEYSIHKANKRQVEITWMDYSRGGLWAGWDIGREYGRPALYGGWYTDFSNYRLSIPEAVGFQGRALYMDVDVIVLQDLWELWTMPLDKPVAVPFDKEGEPDMSIALFNCSEFVYFDSWPRINEMKVNKWDLRKYTQLLKERNLFTPLRKEWYSVDGINFNPETIILHYSNMATQPWEPYAHGYKYLSHPRTDLALLWWRTYAEALEQSGEFAKK
jgi:Glycosyl transferase family 8